MIKSSASQALLSTTSMTRLARHMAAALTGVMAMTSAAHAVTPLPTINDNELPSNPTLPAGGSGSYVINGNVATATQTSQRVIVDWDSFNIGKAATLNYVQPNADAIAVNRVNNGTNPSQILGALNANGHIVILNGNGVIFGANAQVNVASLLVSTGKLSSDSDFMNGVDGKINLTAINAKNGFIQNDGHITVAQGGIAAFVAPQFVNNGIIEANLGKIAIAGGADKATVDMYGDGLVELTMDDNASKAVLSNNGTLRANGGKIAMTVKAAQNVVDSAINMNGVVEANTFQQKNGVISLDATNADIKIASASKITATGSKGNIAVHSTRNTSVAAGATIDAASDSVDNLSTLSLAGDAGLYLDGGTVSATNGNVTLASINGPVIVGATVNAYKLSMNAMGGVAQVGSNTITASKLTASGNTVMLNNAGNQVSRLGDVTVSNMGVFSMSNAADMTVVGAVSTSGGSATLNETGNLSVTGSIDANGGNVIVAQTGILTAAVDSIRTVATGTINLAQNVGGKIQDAINAIKNSGTGTNTVTVGDGTFAENVTINKANVKLVSANGRDKTTIDGVQLKTDGTLSSEEATVFVATGVNNTQIGDIGHGFTINGLDGPMSSEKAAVYLKGSNTNTKVIGNNLVARGDEAFLSDYSSVISNLTIDSNIISGKTFTGAAPASGNQYTVANVARQLVVIGGGVGGGNTSNVTFTNNQITGTAGPNDTSGKGNYLATIDAKTALIDNNSFTGASSGYRAALRARGVDTTISNNMIAGNNARYGIDLDGATNAVVKHNTITNALVGVLVETGTTTATIGGTGANDGNTIMGGMYGIYATAAKTLSVIGNAIGNTANNGITLINVGGTDFSSVANNTITNGGADGIHIEGGKFSVGSNTINTVSGNGISIDGANNSQVGANGITSTGKAGLYVNNVASGSFIYNTVTGSTGTGIDIANSSDASIRNNTVTNSSGAGIKVSTSNNADINTNTVSGTALDGIGIIGGDKVVAQNNTVDNTTRVGIYSAYATNAVIKNNTVTNMKLGGYGAISTDWGSDFTISGNTISQSDQGIRQYMANGANSISGNNIDNVTGDAVHAESTANVSVTGNKIGQLLNSVIGGNGIAVNGATAGAFTGNTIGNTTGNGIALVNVNSDGGDFLDVSNNTIANSKADGIHAEGGSRLSIAFNTINGVTGNGISLDGTANVQAAVNTISNTGKDGLNANNAASGAFIYNDISTFGGNGITIASSNDASIRNNTITGGAFGVMINGTSMNTGVSDNNFIGNDQYIANENGDSTIDVSTANNNFDGKKIGTDITTNAQFSALEDKLTHAMDDSSFGRIITKAKNWFVTMNSGSIQRGVDMADSGDTVNVVAGTFNESVYIDHSVVLSGANAGIAGNGARGDETIIKGTDGSETLYVYGAGVTIDGVTVQGDGVASAMTPDYGILGYGDADTYSVNNTVIKNNIVTGADFGIFLYGDGTVSKSTIANNLITGASAQAIHIRDNNYADITDNTIANSAIGITTENFYKASLDGAASTIDGNTISASNIGIRNNLSYGDQSGFVISNNNIAAEATSGTRRWTGIDVISQLGGTATLFQGNTIDGANAGEGRQSSGYELTNITNADRAVIDGGSVSNTTTGVWATDSSTYGGAVSDLLVKNVAFSNTSDEAILAEDVAGNDTTTNITIGAGNTFSNTNYDLALAGPKATVALDTGFAGVSKTLVKAAGTSHFGTGLTDNASINAGIEATKDGGNVYVADGTFNEDVVIDRSLTLQSLNGNASTTINGVGNTEQGSVVITSDTDGVVLGTGGKGFTLTGVGANQAVVYVNGANALIGGNVIDGENSTNGIVAYNATGLAIGNTDESNMITNTYTGISIDGGANVNIVNNTVHNTYYDGINVSDSSAAFIDSNFIGQDSEGESFGKNNIGGNGVTLDNVASATVQNNFISDTSDNGIGVNGQNNDIFTLRAVAGGDKEILVTDGITLDNNTITNTGSNGIALHAVSNVMVSNNTITGTGDNGIDLVGVSDSTVFNNTITDAGSNGISVASQAGFFIYIPQIASDNVTIDSNTIVNAQNNGIDLYGVNDSTVSNNTITDAGNHGINVAGDAQEIADNNDDGDFPILDFVLFNPFSSPQTSTNVTIDNNTINTAGGNGINADTASDLTITNNTINAAAGNGLNLSAIDGATIDGNTINDNAQFGMYLAPTSTGSFVLTNNTINSLMNGTGARFEGGNIDLSGDANTFNGGTDGLEFLGSTVTLAGNTFGTTAFTGQTAYYIALNDNALYGTSTTAPAQLDARQVSFDGFVPNDFTLGFADYAALEAKLYDYNDDNTLGLILFGYNDVDINDILPQQRLSLSRVNAIGSVTILGLPYATLAQARSSNITSAINSGIFNLRTAEGRPSNQSVSNGNLPFNPQALNSIATASGGNSINFDTTNTNPAALNNIETASGGGARAGCWAQVYSHFGASSAAVTYSLDGSPAAMLSDQASAACK